MTGADVARCPKCGSEDLACGYGFAGGGGLGAWTACLDCDHIEKRVDVPGQGLHEVEPDPVERP